MSSPSYTCSPSSCLLSFLLCALQVSFLAEQDKAVACGLFDPDKCLEGSGKGDKPLYLYLVEDELDRMSLIMVGRGRDRQPGVGCIV